MKHQDYLFNEPRPSIIHYIADYITFLLILLAVVTLPISIFTNFHTWKMLRNLEDIRLDQFKIQQDIQNINQRRCK